MTFWPIVATGILKSDTLGRFKPTIISTLSCLCTCFALRTAHVRQLCKSDAFASLPPRKINNNLTAYVLLLNRLIVLYNYGCSLIINNGAMTCRPDIRIPIEIYILHTERETETRGKVNTIIWFLCYIILFFTNVL